MKRHQPGQSGGIGTAVDRAEAESKRYDGMLFPRDHIENDVRRRARSGQWGGPGAFPVKRFGGGKQTAQKTTC